MAVETSFLIEEEEDEVATTEGSDQLLAILGKARSIDIVPLAFTIEENLEPVLVSGLAISWTREAIATLRRIREEARAADSAFQRNLPYASLRGLMDASLESVSRISRSMGLEAYALDPARQDRGPFIYLE